MKNKKITWDKLYDYSEIEEFRQRINFGLKNKDALIEYFPWLKLLIRNNLKFKRSLEIGSGSGTYSLILKKLGIVEEVYLLDWSENSIKIAKKLFKSYGEDGNFYVGDARKLPFKDKYFDLVFSGGLLEHFGKGNALKILKEEKRVSNYVLTQIPISTIPYWTIREIITIKNFRWPFGYEAPLSIKENMKMYSQANLNILDKEFHDIITAIKFNLNSKYQIKLNLKKRVYNNLFVNEIAILGKSSC